MNSENKSSMNFESKKREQELDSLIYLKQYERRIPFYYTLATKSAFFFILFMAYQIYNGSSMPIISYMILVAGVIVIYRNFTKERYYEIERLYVIQSAINILNFLMKKGKNKTRRYFNEEAERKKQEKLIEKEIKKNKEKMEKLKKLEEDFSDDE